MNIFPKLVSGKWERINLNDESRKVDLDLSSSDKQIEFVNQLHKTRKVNYSYGGFLEDRTYIWRNRQNEKADSMIHLGIDYSVPSGTEVSLPQEGMVFHIMKDPDNAIGWGGRIIFKLKDGNYLLYGHLKQNINLKIGQECKKDEIVGVVGDENENGDWWPHLHVQLMNQIFMDSYQDRLDEIDGYLSKTDMNIKNIIAPNTMIY